MKRVVYITIFILFLLLAFVVWKTTLNKTKYTQQYQQETITQGDDQLYELLDQELEEAVSNITEEEIENMLLSQIG